MCEDLQESWCLWIRILRTPPVLFSSRHAREALQPGGPEPAALVAACPTATFLFGFPFGSHSSVTCNGFPKREGQDQHPTACGAGAKAMTGTCQPVWCTLPRVHTAGALLASLLNTSRKTINGRFYCSVGKQFHQPSSIAFSEVSRRHSTGRQWCRTLRLPELPGSILPHPCTKPIAFVISLFVTLDIPHLQIKWLPHHL